jgi:hypothetical protein
MQTQNGHQLPGADTCRSTSGSHGDINEDTECALLDNLVAVLLLVPLTLIFRYLKVCPLSSLTLTNTLLNRASIRNGGVPRCAEVLEEFSSAPE